MRKRLMFGSAVVLLGILVTLVVWQGSFSLSPAPSTIQQTYLFWAVSTLIFILTVTLGFNLFRTVVKLYIERQGNRPGSHIKSKLIGGALALSVLPIIFLVLWSVSVLNLNLDKWFSRPARTMNIDLVQIANALNQEVTDKLTAQAHWLAAQPVQSADFYERFCQENQIEKAEIQQTGGGTRVLCSVSITRQGDLFRASIPVIEGKLLLTARMPLALAAKQREINQAVADYDRLAVDKKAYRRVYLLLLSLITLFVLFFAIWIARYMAGQISTPITALLRGAEQIRKGNLSYRVRVGAIDEMATLVRAFNEMTEALETNSKELEARRRFTEAILESIPTGVISLTSDGRIQRVNRALLGIFPEEQVVRASRLSDLFSREDTAEIRYLMNRARRTSVAGPTQVEYKAERRVLQLALTVAALDQERSSGFVLVVEDTSELLRAQKAAAWHEVARRVAHEIKNPLTPIALCADRIARQLSRPEQTADTRRILHECSATIAREVECVRTLVDEFSQFTRFPAAQPVSSDLNTVVENALAVFDGRLDGIRLDKDLAGALPPVLVDRDQFKRVVVNLVDNAAEAMQESLVKRLYIGTRFTEADSVELIVADTGCGVSREDKEKLFLPYFSTKGRGTGLGLAIVSRILADHDATIRVEDNAPAGARFVVDLPVRTGAEAEAKTAEMPAAEIRS
ncbi:MAG TPA: ATP-binding protein [Bryobacteraceae bacterium]|jgi:two-component system, NtrC family, nitrogen regulation sensor histidine kinase NtrY|nr:ATP-binding protein [Bryobacteraceae bacterium]